MTLTAELPSQAAATAFDRIADAYDEIFTQTLIGRAQRHEVWRVLQSTFHRGDRVLELNCGTGEDAFFLGREGISVTACDASPKMIEAAQRRSAKEAQAASIEFSVLPTENLGELRPAAPFDGILSNFSGLNCVENLQPVATDLARLVRSGASVCICISTRFCLWETTWFALHGNFQKAFRRMRGRTVANVAGSPVTVWYPAVRGVRSSFAPHFRLRSIRAVGLAVPPSYVRAKAFVRPRAISLLERFDALFGRWPLLRVLGDHVLLVFERVP